jgi:hypothetical protein
MSPTVSPEVRPAFADAVKDNSKITAALERRTESARRASLCCTLAALQVTSQAMVVVDSLVTHFNDNSAQRALLCDIGTTVTARDALTPDKAALWALEQPAMARAGSDNEPLVR